VVRRAAAGGWEGVVRQPYLADRGVSDGGAADQGASELAGPTRQLLAGGAASGCAFELRYFELPPGGRSRRERHHHQHAVVVMSGAGEVELGGVRHALTAGDLVLVGADEPHQFASTGDEPLGFLCVVDSERDRPVPLDASEEASCDL
jgi:quercetin dioxygenase-like cupin family protein